MNESRNILFKKALQETRKKILKEADFPPLRSIEKQLEFLIDLSEGTRTDIHLLDNLNLGLLAAREFEPNDMDYANLIYEVTSAVDNMRFGR